MDQVYNLIRGTNPSPGAWTTINGTEVQIFDCSKSVGDGISSKVMSISEEGVQLQCIGGRIKVKRVRPKGGEKISATEWANSINLLKGDLLGN